MHHNRHKDFVSSSSEIEKKIRSLRRSKPQLELEEMVVIASQKLDPIMDVLLENPDHYDQYLSVEEYQDAVEASNLIKEIIKILESSHIKINVKYLDFELQRYKINVNENNHIFVDTIMLIQLIDLYNVLADIKTIMEELSSSAGVSTIVQTDSLPSIEEEDLPDPNKIVLSLKEPLTDDGSSILDTLQKDYFVFPSMTNINDDYGEAGQERQGFEKINDVHNANKVVIKCIYNLQEVSKYLGLERKDVSTVCSLVQVEEDKQSRRRSTNPEIQEAHAKALGHKCSCEDCVGSKGNIHECEDDKIIICIKGRNQNEGDVKIVIRQCPDCKKHGAEDKDKPETRPVEETKPIRSSESALPTKTEPVSSSSPVSESKLDRHEQPDSKRSSLSSDPALGSDKSHKSVSIKDEKSIISEQEEAKNQDDYDLSEEPEIKEEPPIFFDEKKSLESLVSREESDLEQKIKEEMVIPEDHPQYQAKYSNINLFQTTNLCLKTDTGQELIISLRVTPKEFEARKLSLRDIFSEDESFQKDQKPHVPDATYFVEDHVIPLERTKVCSSLDFDVTVADSKIREKGIKNKNAKIVVKLNDFGIDNLLRACRPAKCCRKSVLNEKMKKSMPYPASLRSLPLDDCDINVINESLQMSLQKVKNSTNLKKDYFLKDLSHVNQMHTVMYFQVKHAKTEDTSPKTHQKLKQKLNYYINLVNDGVNFNPTQKSHKDIKNEVVKKHSLETNKNPKLLDVDIVEVIPSYHWVGQKNIPYEDRPIMTRLNYNDISDLKKQRQENCFKQISADKNTVPKMAKKKSKNQGSRIPVFQKRRDHKGVEVERVDSEVYNISLSSLPRDEGLQKRHPAIDLSALKRDLPKIEKIKPNFPQSSQGHQFLTRSIVTSRYSISSSSSTKKTKRKKREYYLSRSKSETSFRTVNSNKKTRIHREPTEKWFKRNQKISSEKFCKGEDLTKVFFSYVSRFLYDMIVEKLLSDVHLEDLFRNKKTDVQISTTNRSVSGCSNDIKMSQFHLKPSHHDLKAKKSQSCLFYTQNTHKSFLLTNLSMQTSQIISTNRHCQTSQTFIANQLDRNLDITYQKQKLFSKYYSGEALTGIQNSCDQIENFIVVFKSTESLGSEREFDSSRSVQSLESSCNVEESLSNSLLKLKETLERYEQVKKELKEGRVQEGGVNPIEYFVYQVCACNKFQKKPSVIRRILSKTKGLFSSMDRDVCKKFQKESMMQEKEFCRQCGCKISRCDIKQSQTKDSGPCSCPSENKSRFAGKTHEPCCKTRAQSKNSKCMSKIASSSIAKLGAYIKASLANISSKRSSLHSCSCPRKDQNQLNESVKYYSLSHMICAPKNASVQICKVHDSARDTSTQKCDCQKCTNHGQDGTCCCSHCMGCLDKSFDTKPENNDASTSCKCSIEQITENAVAEVPVEESGSRNEIVSSQIANDVTILENSDIPGTNPTTYYLLTSQAMFPDFRLGDANPFYPCVLNIPTTNR